MNEASLSGFNIVKVSPVKGGKSTYNATACVAVGISASTVEIAKGWEIGFGFGGNDNKTGSVIIKGTCLLDSGVLVVSIKKDLVGRA